MKVRVGDLLAVAVGFERRPLVPSLVAHGRLDLNHVSAVITEDLSTKQPGQDGRVLFFTVGRAENTPLRWPPPLPRQGRRTLTKAPKRQR